MQSKAISTKIINVGQRALSANDKVAQELREIYRTHGKFVINLMSSPGSGKTSFLESLSTFSDFRFCVIEGDLQTNMDAQRLENKGILAKQICTGEACHLEANMIKKILPSLESDPRFATSEFLFIENVGNLVCPASYDLGTHINIVMLSTPEGDDKILKYPSMFLCADIILLTKWDLQGHFNFDSKKVLRDMEKLKHNVEILEISMKNSNSIKRAKEKIVELKDKMIDRQRDSKI